MILHGPKSFLKVGLLEKKRYKLIFNMKFLTYRQSESKRLLIVS